MKTCKSLGISLQLLVLSAVISGCVTVSGDPKESGSSRGITESHLVSDFSTIDSGAAEDEKRSRVRESIVSPEPTMSSPVDAAPGASSALPKAVPNPTSQQPVRPTAEAVPTAVEPLEKGASVDPGVVCEMGSGHLEASVLEMCRSMIGGR